MKQSLKGEILKKVTYAWAILSIAFCYLQCNVYAEDKKEPAKTNNISDTTLAKGLTNLFNDLSSWLLVIIPIAGALLMLINYLKQMAEDDEMDEKPHKKKTKSILLIIICAECITGIINVLTTKYFKG